jgi:lipopolysaccharide assembly protein A
MRFFKTIVLLLLLGAVVLFAAQNMELVKLRFLTWHIGIPLSLASILLYILGAVSGGLVFSMLKKLSQNSSDRKNS